MLAASFNYFSNRNEHAGSYGSDFRRVIDDFEDERALEMIREEMVRRGERRDLSDEYHDRVHDPTVVNQS